MFALDDPWHKDDNTRTPAQTHAGTEASVVSMKKNEEEKEQLVGQHLAPTAGGSLQRENLNFRWRFLFFFVFAGTGEEPKGGIKQRAGATVEHCHMWLEILNLFATPSSVSVSFCRARLPTGSLFSLPPPPLGGATCRMRIYIFSCSALLLLLFLFLQLTASPALCARFESFKRNIVEITLCPTDWRLATEVGWQRRWLQICGDVSRTP